MSEARKTNDEDLSDLSHTYRNAKAIKNLIQSPGGIVGDIPNLEDVGVPIPKTEQGSLLAQACNMGFSSAIMPAYQSTNQSNSQSPQIPYSRDDEITDMLNNLGF
jgi:hypothetical protein